MLQESLIIDNHCCCITDQDQCPFQLGCPFTCIVLLNSDQTIDHHENNGLSKHGPFNVAVSCSAHFDNQCQILVVLAPRGNVKCTPQFLFVDARLDNFAEASTRCCMMFYVIMISVSFLLDATTMLLYHAPRSLVGNNDPFGVWLWSSSVGTTFLGSPHGHRKLRHCTL